MFMLICTAVHPVKTACAHTHAVLSLKQPRDLKAAQAVALIHFRTLILNGLFWLSL